MAFERGGRTDKFGNRYEDRYVVKCMISLLREQISSITIEPVGEDENGVDILIDKGNNILEFHQCKSRNGDSDKWTLASLANHKMFTHIREHVISSHNFYVWVSPLTFIEFTDLCNTAKNYPSSDIFYHSPLSHAKKSMFDKVRTYFELPENDEGVAKTFFYLNQTKFELVSDGSLSVEMDQLNLASLFIGNEETIYDVLINFPKNDFYGKPITALTLLQYLEQRGFQRRTYADEVKISASIQNLNAEFADWFHPIGNFLWPTSTSQDLLRAIKSHSNVLLLGAAGSGKSGCISILQKHLECSHIPYLAIKLDKHPPAYSLRKYIQDLDLPMSPVLCLQSMTAKGNTGVLILDQLDSLRWTSAHSETALSICKRILAQAQSISEKKIIVVLVSRSFDFENDTELKSLCLSSQEQNTKWTTIHTKPWDENTIKQLTGADTYAQLSPQTQNLLRIPNNLFVWMNLDPVLRHSAFEGSTDLIESWIQQTRKHAEVHGISTKTFNECLKVLLKCSQTSSAVHRNVLNAEDSIVEFCLSEGLLYQNKSTVSFSHQSIVDYLNVEQSLQTIYEQNIPVENTLPAFDFQLPSVRVRVQMLWLKLLDCEESLFILKGREFLESERVRFYYKCTFWEAVGQSPSPGEETLALILDYWTRPDWHDFLYQVVFYTHLPFVHQYVACGFAKTWMEPHALHLLSSIFNQDPEFVLDCLESYAFQNDQDDRSIYQCFSFIPSEKSHRVFDFRMQMLERHPDWGVDSYAFVNLVQTYPLRAIQYLKYLISVSKIVTDSGNHEISADFLQLAQTHPQDIIEELADAIIQLAPLDKFSLELYQWSENNTHLCIYRFFVQLIEKALFATLQKDSGWVHNFIMQHLHTKSIIEHEWILKILAELPSIDSDLVYTWLTEDFPSHFFEYTSSKKDQTYYACDILLKFSHVWTEEQFNSLEQRIFCYHEPNELICAQTSFQRKKEYGYEIFIPYWGKLQQELLPCLDPNRVAQKTKDLIAVLQRRNSLASGESSYRKFPVSEVYTVHSPISNRTKLLSDSAWVHLLCTCNQKKAQSRKRWSGDGSESSPEQFALSFQLAMKEDPERVLRIIKRLPCSIEKRYICAIFRIIAQPTVFNSLPLDEVTTEIRRFLGTFSTESNPGISTSFCEILEKNCAVSWPADFYEHLCFLACSHQDPALGEYHLTSYEDPNHSTAESLVENSLNCVRGFAFYTISHVLYNQPDSEMIFLNSLKQGLTDAHPAVRYSLIECLGAIYSINKDLACNWFHVLVKQDFRVLAHPLAPRLVFADFPKHRHLYKQAIEKAFHSFDVDLVKRAGIIAVVLNQDKNEMASLVFRDHYTEAQAEGLSIQLAFYIMSPENKRAKAAVLHLLAHYEKIPSALLHQYCKVENILRIDPEVFHAILGKDLNSDGRWMIIKTFNNLDTNAFYQIRTLIYSFCLKVCSNKDQGYDHLVLNDIPQILLRLLDLPNLTAEERTEYLSLFDLAYQSSVLTTNRLLREIQK